MVVFKRDNGHILIMHNHSFSVCDFYHRFDLIVIRPNGRITEEQGIKIDEKLWESYIKSLGNIQKKPLEVDL